MALSTDYRMMFDQVLRRPLTRMLLLSLSLHLAVLLVVQPRSAPISEPVTVIDARLVSDKPLDVPPLAPPVKSKQAQDKKLSESVLPPPETPKDDTPPELPPVSPSPSPAGPEAAEDDQGLKQVLPSVPVMVDTNWYEARQLDIQPRASQPIDPIYPPPAVQGGVEGNVVLLLRVDEFGIVRDIEVEEATPPGVFDASALEAFREARFQPAIRHGLPVRAVIRIRVNYQMNGDR